MSMAIAASQGYTVANSFQPSSFSSGTVRAGLNLGSACTAAGVALCADRLAVARPTGSSAWDAGAYFFNAAAGNQVPLITQEPASRIVATGQTATFSVVATGIPAPAYQWQKNGVAIAGATATSYTTPTASSGDDGTQFTVVVSNGSGSVQSGVAILSVRNVPGLLTSSASSVNVGNVYVGITGQAQVTLTNSGQIDVAISNVSVAGPGFQVGGVSVGTILTPGQSIQMRLTFTPSSIGSVPGSVTVASDSGNSPLIISLSGTGVALTSHAAILSWVSAASDVIGYRIYRSTASTAFALLSVGVQSTTNYADLAVSAGQTYSYVVTAIDSDNFESIYSNQVTVVIPTP
jgi:Abnormal spindle-like microcephaly-assoc'd, ASPM-SPD-2-Hydin